MIAPQIAQEQHKDPGALGVRPEKPERLVRIAGGPELDRLESERVADGGDHARDRSVDGRGSEKPERRQVVVIVQHGRAQEPLTGLDIPNESVEHCLVPCGSIRRRCAKVSTPVRPPRGLRQVERHERPVVLLRHPGQHGAGWWPFAVLHRPQPVDRHGSLRVRDGQLPGGIFLG